MTDHAARCHFIPPYLLTKLVEDHPDDPEFGNVRRTLEVDATVRERRREAAIAAAVGDGAFAIHSADNGSELPGKLVRKAGDPESGDLTVDEAYTGVEASLALFSEVFGRDSYDGRGAPVTATVHYEQNYVNAFWDGAQLVFGDGDGKVFERFTKPVDVLGHELSHAVVQFTANLTYQDQSGALNESVCDVFGACLKQRLAGETVDEADWLVGEGIFLPGVQGRALRSMSEPGTAYDDPAVGKDPQVGSMADYVQTDEDNGGVHLNSGIPNRAFVLAARAVGGNAWEGAGRIWYAALTSGIPADSDFAGFAAATIAAAREVSAEAEQAVAAAWDEVGVQPVEGSRVEPGPRAPAGGGAVKVVRTGGIAGMTQSAEVSLGDDPRTAEIEDLLGRIDLAAVTTSDPQPDRFVYTLVVHGESFTVGEPDLTPDLERLVLIVLR